MERAAPDRGRRLEHQQRAYELQLIGGLQGMFRWTIYGLVGVGLAHQFLPTFRKQTWAIKAFLVSSSSIFGLVIGADDYLLRYESQQRDSENAIRREARNALARRGIIATESEIRRWRAERDAERRASAAEAAEAADAAEMGESVEASHVARLARGRRPPPPTADVPADVLAVVETPVAAVAALEETQTSPPPSTPSGSRSGSKE